MKQRRLFHAIAQTAIMLLYAQPSAGIAPVNQNSPSQSEGARSIYDLNARVTTSDGRDLDLASLKGSPVLYTMFFATCPGVCPMMTRQIQALEDKLSAGRREKLRVIMVSFDESDTVERLKIYAGLHRVDPTRWVIARTSPSTAGALGDFLGIEFQRLPGGSYAHSAFVGIVDAQGRLVASVPNTSLDDERLLRLVSGVIEEAGRQGNRNKAQGRDNGKAE